MPRTRFKKKTPGSESLFTLTADKLDAFNKVNDSKKKNFKIDSSSSAHATEKSMLKLMSKRLPRLPSRAKNKPESEWGRIQLQRHCDGLSPWQGVEDLPEGVKNTPQEVLDAFLASFTGYNVPLVGPNKKKMEQRQNLLNKTNANNHRSKSSCCCSFCKVLVFFSLFLIIMCAVCGLALYRYKPDTLRKLSDDLCKFVRIRKLDDLPCANWWGVKKTQEGPDVVT